MRPSQMIQNEIDRRNADAARDVENLLNEIKSDAHGDAARLIRRNRTRDAIRARLNR